MRHRSIGRCRIFYLMKCRNNRAFQIIRPQYLNTLKYLLYFIALIYPQLYIILQITWVSKLACMDVCIDC